MKTGLGVRAMRDARTSLAAAALLLSSCMTVAPATSTDADLQRWQQQAEQVTIVRDNWGIAHVHGRSDADAVFGMIYAQAEDDFNRVETNFINAMGRLAEAEGESAIWQDLRMKMFIQPEDLKARYAASPDWLKRLMVAWADGLNFYLRTHPEVKPRVITRFEPWMALSFSEGSIGGDIERVALPELEAFYSKKRRTTAAVKAVPEAWEPTGSNGFAIAPSNAAGRKALLLINPHTSFFFRSEQRVRSDEGLNAYGAATWGQFFLYQGFNDRLGWMHTSTGFDTVDEFAETIVRRNGRLFYRYGKEERPLVTSTITVPYRTANGSMASRSFEVFRTHHGPIVREENGKWVSIALMHRPVEALSQSYLRTKARDYRGFMQTMALKANSSNNTIYSDAGGNIVFLAPQFVPRRDDRFDYTRPVDGSDPATDWKGMHELSELPHLLNPKTGWIQNTNNWPWSAAGPDSPKRSSFPRYMDEAGENPRGIAAVRVLSKRREFDLQSLIDAAYDRHLPAFAMMIPSLVDAWDKAPAGRLKSKLADPVAALRNWDHRWSTESVPMSLAVFWAEEMWTRLGAEGAKRGMGPYESITHHTTADAKLDALSVAVDRLAQDFGSWKTKWGEINRFQRLTGDIVQPFSDAAPSVPVGFTSSRWGSLAAFGAQRYPGTRRYYGTRGNSFVAVVEFGDKVRARAVSAGGESGDPRSPHFADQTGLYAKGELREVYFYPEQLKGHARRTYHPGK